MATGWRWTGMVAATELFSALMTETEPWPAGCAGVDDVDFVARGAGGDGDGILADGELAVEADVDHVETVTVSLPPLVT